MAEEGLKSSREIALERLRRDAPEDEPTPLSDDQKARISTVRRDYKAKLAEAEILHKDAVRKEFLQATPETAQKLQKMKEEYGRERVKLQRQMEKEIEKIRQEKG